MPIKFGDEIHLDAATAEQKSHPQLLGLADGRFVASWTESTAGGSSQIHVQMFNADGGRHGTEFVGTPVILDGTDQQLNATSDGGFALSWSEYGTGTLDIVAQRFDPDGAVAGSKIV